MTLEAELFFQAEKSQVILIKHKVMLICAKPEAILQDTRNWKTKRLYYRDVLLTTKQDR